MWRGLSAAVNWPARLLTVGLLGENRDAADRQCGRQVLLTWQAVERVGIRHGARIGQGRGEHRATDY